MTVEASPEDTLAVLRHLAAGKTPLVVGTLTDHTTAFVTEIAQTYGYPDRDALADAVVALGKAVAGSKNGAPPRPPAPAAPRETPAPQQPPRGAPSGDRGPNPGAIAPRPPAPPAQRPTLGIPPQQGDLLRTGMEHPDEEIRKQAEQAMEMLRVLGENITRKEAIDRARRKVERLHVELAEAEAELAALGGKPKRKQRGGVKPSGEPDTSCKWPGCDRKARGRVGVSNHMKRDHGITLKAWEAENEA